MPPAGRAPVGFPASRWAFKHWPIVTPAEGMAVLSPHRITAATAFAVQHWFPWSWRRRIAIEATVLVDARPVRVLNVHLSPHEAHEQRLEEVARIRPAAASWHQSSAVTSTIGPGGPAYDELRAAGWTDAWSAAHPDRAVDARPTRRGPRSRPGSGRDQLDRRRSRRPPADPAARCRPRAGRSGRCVSCDVVAEPLDELAALSDHLTAGRRAGASVSERAPGDSASASERGADGVWGRSPHGGTA